jgi:hypothetical protein
LFFDLSKLCRNDLDFQIADVFGVVDIVHRRVLERVGTTLSLAMRRLSASTKGAHVTLPITIDQAKAAAKWLKTNFGAEMASIAATSPIDSDLLCAVACQEAACYWLGWTRRYTPQEIVAHCVFDASGDIAGFPRNARPRNTAEFRATYGDTFADMLIAEANVMRSMRNLTPAQIVYKGYGIFQYDLQFVAKDRAFFETRLWRLFRECATRAHRELAANYQQYGDLRTAVRAYNGTGANAQAYADNVMTFLAACKTVVVQ